jgi:hypothetical protein
VIRLAAGEPDLHLPGQLGRTVFEIASDGPATVHGIAPFIDPATGGAAADQALALVNRGNHPITLEHQSDAGAAGHRIHGLAEQNNVCGPGGAFFLWYKPARRAWFVLRAEANAGTLAGVRFDPHSCALTTNFKGGS